MSMKIDGDLGRFKDLIKGRVKRDIKKLVSSEHLVGSVGGKTVKIPLNSIDIPRFSFGGQNGGAGSGDGDVGDPMPGQGKGKGRGKGEAGNDEGEHMMMEFSPSELAEMISEYLELPELQPRGHGDTECEGKRYTGINRIGNNALRHNQRTYKEALKRQIGSGEYNPSNPLVVPIKSDFRYRTAKPIPKPEIDATIFYVCDISGSFDDQKKKLAASTAFWIDTLLTNAYPKLTTEFIVHDTKAWSCSREDFFKYSTGGGTLISSAYTLMWDIIQKKYSDTNVYAVQFSDSENISSDNPTCQKLLNEHIIPSCNIFAYNSVKASLSEEFYVFLEKNVSKKIRLSSINDEDGILASIKTFFGQGL